MLHLVDSWLGFPSSIDAGGDSERNFNYACWFARHRATDFLKQMTRERRMHVGLNPEDMRYDPAGWDDEPEQGEGFGGMAEHVRLLPPAEREVIELRYGTYELTQEAVAERLGKSRRTVRGLEEQARERLRRKISQEI